MLRRDPGLDPDEIVLEQPDLVVVDVPRGQKAKPLFEPILDAPGMEEVPVIVVLEQTSVSEVAGVRRIEDFVCKPLRPKELVVRARRPLLRHGRDDDDTIRMGALVVDLRGYEASLAGAPVDLTYQEFKLLQFLVSHPAQAFSRDQLLSRVWGYDYYGGSRTVDIHVRRIRAKLGGYATYLKTVRHVGYKWVMSTQE